MEPTTDNMPDSSSNNSNSVYFTTATNDAHLKGILALQRANRPEVWTEEEQRSQGFISARHDLDLLRDMNAPHAHTIALDANHRQVVGYALSLVRTFDVDRIPYITGLNGEIQTAVYQGTPVRDLNYIIMGQVCVDKAYRGQGVLQGLYHSMRSRLAAAAAGYDCVVTAVSTQNPRSLHAHAKVGFIPIHQFTGHGHEWIILLWDWRRLSQDGGHQIK